MKSSVEWLFEQVCSLDWKYIQGEKKLEIFEQAKAMHRIEILEARQNGLDNGFSNGSWDSQLYYTEEFGGNNEQQ